MTIRLQLERALASAAALTLGALALSAPAAADDVRLRQSVGGVCSDCDFAGRDLHSAPIIGNLPRANFAGAILSDTEISGNFTAAVFARADLSGAEISNANLAGADFSGAKLDGAGIVGSNLFSVDLTGATLREASLGSTNLVGADLLGAKLNGAVLTALIATNAEFARADLSGASLIGAELDRARFIEADLTRADLSGASAQEADFTGANLAGANLDNVDFSGADLSGALGLSFGALAQACGSENTQLPPGFTLEACADPQNRFRRTRNWRRVIAWRDDSSALLLISTSPDTAPRSRGASDTAPDFAILRRVNLAHAALAPAHAAAQAELNLRIRDAVSEASAALTEVDASSYAGARIGFERALAAIEEAQEQAAGGPAADAIGQARAGLENELNALTNAENDQFEPSGILSQDELARARRAAQSALERDGYFSALQIERELDAQQRTLDARCNQRLNVLELTANDVAGVSENGRRGRAAPANVPASVPADAPAAPSGLGGLAAVDEATIDALRRGVEESCDARATEIEAERRMRRNALAAELQSSRADLDEQAGNN